MLSLKNKNKIGILGALLLLFSAFISQVVFFVQYHFNAYIPYQIYSVINVVAIVINLIILLAFIKDFFSNRNIVTVIMGGAFAVYSLLWPFIPTLISYLGLYEKYYGTIYERIFNFIPVLFSVVLFIIVSVKLFRTEGFARLIGLGGFVYVLLYLANSIWNFLYVGSYSFIISIIALFYGLVPSILLVLYFLFVENE